MSEYLRSNSTHSVREANLSIERDYQNQNNNQYRLKTILAFETKFIYTDANSKNFRKGSHFYINFKGIKYKIFPDCKYYGEILNEKRHGKGLCNFINGDTYLGDTYIGDFKNDKFDGKGIYFFADGDFYNGELKEGLKDGKGIYNYSNGNQYDGDWSKDKKSGSGVFKYKSTDEVYDGEMKDGVRNGIGTFHYKFGEKYEGGWKDGKKEGEGVMKYPSGTTIEGRWSGDVMGGEGVANYHTGEKYVGRFVNGCRQGKGIYTYSDGSKYDGEWYQDQKHGKGVITYPSSAKYEGTFKNNLKNGQGIYTNPSGDIYDGSFLNDKRHGIGKMVHHNGDVYEGDWVDGLKEGRGYYTWENGDVYEGEFKNGVREGFGEFKWANGESYKGLWKEDNMAKGEVFDNFGQLFKDLSPSTFLKGKISRFGSPMNKRARNLSEPLPFLSNYALNDYCYNPPKFDLLKIKTDFFKMEVNSITHTPLKKRKTYLKKERSPFEISKSIAPEKLNALAKRIKTEEEKKEDKKRASIVEMEKNLLYFDTDKVKKNNKILNRRPIIADVYFQYYKNKNQNSLCNLKELSNLLNIHEYQKSMKKEKKKEEKDLELQKLIDEYGRKKKIWEKIDPNMEITEKDKKLMQNPKKLKLTFLILPKNVNKLFN